MERQTSKPGGQLAPELAKNGAASLYRLAFLITGDRAWGLELTLEAIDSGDDTDSFFSGWILAWSHRLAIAKVLGGIRDELATSARRTAALHDVRFALASGARLFDPDSDGAGCRIENALLAIDVFPRCALLLTVFEGVSAEDAAVLLNADRELIQKARNVGLEQLTRNLAGMRDSKQTAARSLLRIKELQHA